MKKALLSLLLTFLFLSPSLIFAKSDEEIAKKYGITFPIVELGGSQSLEECNTFCSQLENKDACLSYAKKKGFYGEGHYQQQPHSSKNNEEILKYTKAELGCSTYDQCMNFCDQKSNFPKCEEFASKHGLGGQEMKKMTEVMSKLGCHSQSECMTFCSSPANMQKCMIAFQSAGFDTGIHNMTLGECQKTSPPHWQCRLEEQICICSQPQEPSEVWCPKAGPDCRWKDNTCFCGETVEEYCAKQSGCRMEGKICACNQGSASESGEVWEASQSAESTHAPAVQGVTTNQGLLQKFVQFISDYLLPLK